MAYASPAEFIIIAVAVTLFVPILLWGISSRVLEDYQEFLEGNSEEEDDDERDET